MTWHADQTEGRPAGEARDELLQQRAQLVKDIETLRATPLPSKSQASLLGRQEDFGALAKKILVIDKKLGRA